ncbi:hypothetical protein D0T87_23625 [Bacteroides sp. 51]|nr:hypothetical protein [Bacteroides sp. 51]
MRNTEYIHFLIYWIASGHPLAMTYFSISFYDGIEMSKIKEPPIATLDIGVLATKQLSGGKS